MADMQSRERLQPSLLDRLTDDAPERQREAPDQQSLSLGQLRHAVLRDLGWLLNTTQLDLLEDLSDAPLAARSTINYGVSGIAGAVMTQQRTASLEAKIVEAIRMFEPRIRPDSIRVRLRTATTEDTLAHVVFDIEGELWAKPVPMQLFLETSFDADTKAAIVIESRSR